MRFKKLLFVTLGARCLLSTMAVLFLQQAIAQTPSEMNDQVAATRLIKQVALSPDGRTVVATITDPTSEGGHTHLWILSKTDAPKQLTSAGADNVTDDDNPQWGADSSTVFYLEKKPGGSTIKRIDIKSRSSETLSLAHRGSDVIASWEASPAGELLDANGFALARSGALAAWATDASNAIGKATRKEDQHVFGDTEQVRLYLIDERGALEVRLPDNVRSVAWSVDGASLLAVTEPASDDLGALNRLWFIEKNQAPREIRGTAENVQAASWLPDGRIVYTARCSQSTPIVCLDLFVQALDGSAPQNLTDRIEGSLINGVATQGPLVTRSGEILVTVARSFQQPMARIRPADKRLQWIDTPPAVVRSIASNATGTRFALLGAERGDINSVYLADSKIRSYTKLALPTLQPMEWRPLQGRRIEWISDHHTVDALLYLPVAVRAQQQFPLVVDVHGGPAGRFDDSDYPLVRLLLAEGWAVLHVNPRGSLGYGTDFLASIQDDLGGADYRDVMGGIDAALAQAPLDEKRIALIGFSYGATIASFALGRTTRFTALVAAAPVADQISEYGTESSSWYDRWYFGQPWKRLEAAWRQSPLSGVAKATTPLLLFQGEGDTTNPPGQSLELYRALRQEGCPVELILFPRETHRELGQNYFGYPSIEPRHGIVLRERLLGFLRDAFSGKPHAGLQVATPP